SSGNTMTSSVAFETSIPTNTSVICTLLVPILATYGRRAPATVRVNGGKRRDDLDSLAGLSPRARPIYRARNNYLIHTRVGEGFCFSLLSLEGGRGLISATTVRR